MASRYELRGAATRWLSSFAPDVFITVTLKRGLLDVHGIWQNMDAYQAERTGEIIKDRIIKKISVKGILERPQIPFFTSYEVASGNWNPHLHAVSLIPTGMSFEEYDERCRRAISHLRSEEHTSELQSH